jgi:intracellular sulfur oxidation DsrE/DsrF family protein
MAKRFNKLTPIATSVALSLGLTGCFGDNDNNVKAKPLVDGVANVDFNIAVSGRAVKGTLKNAALSIKTVNANGELVDVAFRTEVTSVEEKASATTEDEAKSLAEKAILDASPSLLTGEKGEYTIYLASDFSGPLHITVQTKKDGDDSLVKCDAFIGCGDFSDSSDLDANSNNKVDFGEWYKDDLALSVVKLITKTSSESSSARGIQYAEGDAAASFKANVTLFTSVAAAILIADGEINANLISQASSKVIRSLIGDESLLATLTADISGGGAVDFTDVDGTESIDAGVLTMIQVAASIQAVAAKGENGSISDVIEQLRNDVKDDNLEASDTFTALRVQAKLAGKILAAVVSGDIDAVKAALIAAGVNEETAEQTAAAAIEAKDKAVESGATTEEDLKEDADKSEKQLDDIGDGEALENAELAESLINSLTELKTGLASIQAQMAIFETQIANIDELAEKEDKSNQEVVDYGVAATEFQRAVSESNISAASTQLTNKIVELVSSTNGLAAKDAQYQAIADDAAAQKPLVDSENVKVQALVASSEQHLVDAAKAVEELNLGKQFAKETAESAIETAKQAETNAVSAEVNFSVIKTRFDDAVGSIENAQDAQTSKGILAELELAYSLNKETAEKFLSDASNALEKANIYVEEAKSTDEEDDSIATQASTSAMYTQALEHYNTVFGNERINQMSTGVAKVGTGKLVNLSAVSREGADAVFNVGEVIFDVIKDILDNGSFGTGQQSGTSEKYPDWEYSYDTERYSFTFRNTRDGQIIDANGSLVSDARSMFSLTWSGMLKSENGQMLNVLEQDSGECRDYGESFYDKDIYTPNASCLVIHINDYVNKLDDVDSDSVDRVTSYNLITFTDGPYGFDGFVSFDVTATDVDGESVPIFNSDVTQHLDLVVQGTSELVEFKTSFNVMYKEPVEEIGSMTISLLNYHGYEFSVNLVDESGPLIGEVSTLDEDLTRFKAGDISEIENGFRINYISNEVIDYTNIEVYGDR